MSLAGASAPTTTSRLIDRYLAIGLACVLGCIVAAIGLAWNDALMRRAALIAVAPLILLLAGAFLLRRTLRTNEAIERQLRQLATGASATGFALRPLADSAPVARGWNALVHQLGQQETLSSLEKRLCETLDMSEGRRWEAIVNALPDGVAVCDKHDRVVLANTPFLAMFDAASMGQVRGKPLSDLFSLVFSATSTSALAEFLQGDGNFSTELRKGDELATGVWRLSRTPLPGDAFEAGSYLWTQRDVTQHKLAGEMRDQFVFTATHELRTPLANIKAYAETLAADAEIDVERQKGFYNIINAEATRLARFVDELLNISQMEAGAITIVRNEADVQRLLEDVCEHMQPQIRQKRLRFQSTFPAKFPTLRIDKDKVSAALVNLLGNAVKYTSDGGDVRLLVEADGESIYFHVEDTGIGISPEELSKVGQKLFRSSDARVQAVGGSGLGLAFVQEVARLHGGALTLRSELDKGSRFSFSLPVG